MDCNTCKKVDPEQASPVPYLVHEGTVARMERTIKRLWILAILLVSLLVVTNAIWIWYESQFEDVATTVTATQDTQDGGSNYAVAGDMFGASASNSNEKDENP